MTQYTIWGPMEKVISHRQRATRLYRKCLHHLLSWDMDRAKWRDNAVRLRVAFEQFKDVKDPRNAKAILKKAEEEFFKYQHPQPYIAPYAPGGTLYERNMPPHPKTLELLPIQQEWLDEWIEYYSTHPQD